MTSYIRELPLVTVSVVSHGHGSMVDRLVSQLQACPQVAKIILTLNVAQPLRFENDDIVFLVINPAPKGFGANHNAAFSQCDTPFFCVLNPDVELKENPFEALLSCLQSSQADLAAPLSSSPQGKLEDSIRYFPTWRSLVLKGMRGDEGRQVIDPNLSWQFVDWVGGMFMLFRSPSFASLGGFDEGYFLYYEDVDICKRVWQRGMKVIACPSVEVIHDARRASHKSLRHLRWHLASMVRYLFRR